MLLISATEHLIFYIILVVLLLVYWKNQVRGILVARGYLGLFSFFFSSRRTGRPCLLACLRRYSRERAPRSLGENSIHYSFASLVCTPIGRVIGTGTDPDTAGCIRILQDASGYFRMRKDTAGCVRLPEDASGHRRISRSIL